VELIAKDHNGVAGPYTQQGHKWSDGSVETDLPMARLAELFNINYFIVSQVNPHVVPILRHATQPGPQGLIGTVLRLFGSEVKHRAAQVLTWPYVFRPLQTTVV
jgi:predicted acylesterase/phospholipase RssA